MGWKLLLWGLTCPFFKEFDQVLHTVLSTEPPALHDSLDSQDGNLLTAKSGCRSDSCYQTCPHRSFATGEVAAHSGSLPRDTFWCPLGGAARCRTGNRWNAGSHWGLVNFWLHIVAIHIGMGGISGLQTSAKCITSDGQQSVSVNGGVQPALWHQTLLSNTTTWNSTWKPEISNNTKSAFIITFLLET